VARARGARGRAAAQEAAAGGLNEGEQPHTLSISLSCPDIGNKMGMRRLQRGGIQR